MKVNGALIRHLRLQRSWSQETLAERAGVNLRTIQRCESNGAASLQTRGSIAAALQVEVSAIDLPIPAYESDDRPTRWRGDAASIVLGFYVLSAIALFGFVVLDQSYSYLIGIEIAAGVASPVLSEVADLLLLFTMLSIILAAGAISLIWNDKRVRLLLSASCFSGLILPIVILITLTNLAPGFWAYLDESGSGALVRFVAHAFAAVLALWGWFAYSRSRDFI